MSKPADSKKRRQSLSLEQKLEIIACYDKGESTVDILRATGIHESTLRTIRDNAKKVKKRVVDATEDVRMSSKKLRKKEFLEMDGRLYAWMDQQAEEDHEMAEAKKIREKALSIYEDLEQKAAHPEDVKKFKASRGWCQKFKKRYATVRIVHLKNEIDEQQCEHPVWEENPDSVIKNDENSGPKEDVKNTDATGYAEPAEDVNVKQEDREEKLGPASDCSSQQCEHPVSKGDLLDSTVVNDENIDPKVDVKNKEAMDCVEPAKEELFVNVKQADQEEKVGLGSDCFSQQCEYPIWEGDLLDSTVANNENIDPKEEVKKTEAMECAQSAKEELFVNVKQENEEETLAYEAACFLLANKEYDDLEITDSSPPELIMSQLPGQIDITTEEKSPWFEKNDPSVERRLLAVDGVRLDVENEQPQRRASQMDVEERTLNSYYNSSIESEEWSSSQDSIKYVIID